MHVLSGKLKEYNICEDWAFFGSISVLFSVMIHCAAFKLILIFIFLHKGVLWHLSLACGHNCLGCCRINTKGGSWWRKISPVFRHEFPVKLIRQTGEDWNREGYCSFNLVFSNLNKVSGYSSITRNSFLFLCFLDWKAHFIV